MSHSAMRFHRTSAGVGRSSPALGAEKLGVMGGFVAGLVLAVGTVHDAVLAQGLPDLAADGAAVVTVALVTWVGLRVGAAVGRLSQRG